MKSDAVSKVIILGVRGNTFLARDYRRLYCESCSNADLKYVIPFILTHDSIVLASGVATLSVTCYNYV